MLSVNITTSKKIHDKNTLGTIKCVLQIYYFHSLNLHHRFINKKSQMSILLNGLRHITFWRQLKSRSSQTVDSSRLVTPFHSVDKAVFADYSICFCSLFYSIFFTMLEKIVLPSIYIVKKPIFTTSSFTYHFIDWQVLFTSSNFKDSTIFNILDILKLFE